MRNIHNIFNCNLRMILSKPIQTNLKSAALTKTTANIACIEKKLSSKKSIFGKSISKLCNNFSFRTRTQRACYAKHIKQRTLCSSIISKSTIFGKSKLSSFLCSFSKIHFHFSFYLKYKRQGALGT